MKKHDKEVITFTKKWVSRLLWFGCGWITWSYILASFGKTEIAEMLSKTVVQVIIATFLGYLLKAFFETYAEEKIKLIREGVLKSEDFNIEGIESEEGEG